VAAPRRNDSDRAQPRRSAYVPRREGNRQEVANLIVQLVRYNSGLTYDEVMERFVARSDRYREVPGLLQKYYVHYSASNEYGGVYVWESEQALQRWRETNLAETLAETYRVTDGPRAEIADVMLILHDGSNPL
jgi:heme-degrading monooxygenase HmoA